MTITSIRDYQSRDIIEALLDLMERAEQGKLRGFAFAIKTGTRSHRLGITGDYWRDPSEALACVTRMEYRLNELMSERGDDGPETKTMPL